METRFFVSAPERSVVEATGTQTGIPGSTVGTAPTEPTLASQRSGPLASKIWCWEGKQMFSSLDVKEPWLFRKMVLDI